ncbi:MAG: dienelactone hydrolase family protein [Acidobacteria bacterium]|nr:dienelactone hydrolase family protein [Acidobacteriota bacterium]
MERKTTADFDPDLLVLFNAYVHGDIDRRGFLDKARRFAVGGVTAAMLLDQLSPNFAEAQVVAPDDKRLKIERVPYPSPQGSDKTSGYLVRPATAEGKLPGIVVIHENRGLNPHIEDIARRLALDNFVTFAPDALAPLGGYPGTEDEARGLFGKLDPAKSREDMLAAASFLKDRPDCTGKVGVVGFCWGGMQAHSLATRMPELAAAVPFYGSNPPPEEAAKVRAPLLVHLAASDDRINNAWPEYEKALKAAGATYEMYMYPGTDHGFNNDTTPRFDEAAAKLASQRTVDFFNKHLRG